jgi:hypothetical protein
MCWKFKFEWFKLHFANTLSNAKMIYIWNVDLDEWNNIGIHDFSSRDHPGFRKPAFGYEFFQNSKFSGSKFTNEMLTIRPNVGLDEWNKLCIHEFSIRDLNRRQNLVEGPLVPGLATAQD